MIKLIKNFRTTLFIKTPTTIKITPNNVAKYPIIPIKSKIAEHISSNTPQTKVTCEINFN